MRIPDFLSHYYEKSAGLFSNLSMLPIEQAEEILTEICQPTLERLLEKAACPRDKN